MKRILMFSFLLIVAMGICFAQRPPNATYDPILINSTRKWNNGSSSGYNEWGHTGNIGNEYNQRDGVWNDESYTSLYKFDLSQIPANYFIATAHLKAYVTDGTQDWGAFVYYGSSNAASLMWDGTPNPDQTTLAARYSASAGFIVSQWYSTSYTISDVLAAVTAARRSPEHSIVFFGTGGHADRPDRSAATLHLQLVLEFRNTPISVAFQNNFTGGTMAINGASRTVPYTVSGIAWNTPVDVASVAQTDPQGYARVWNNYQPNLRSEWEHISGGSHVSVGSSVNYHLLPEITDDGTTYQADMRKIYNVSRTDQSELDGSADAGVVAQAVEGNAVMTSAPGMLLINNKDNRFVSWSDGVTANPRSDIPTNHTRVTALYKSHLASSLSAATGLTSQRKLVVDENVQHMVYESSGEVWYTRSTDNGTTWEPEVRLSSGRGLAHNPSISPYDWWNSTSLYAVWVEATQRTGATGYDIMVSRIPRTGGNPVTEAIVHPDFPQGAGFASADAHPVAVAYRQQTDGLPHVIVAYEGSYGGQQGLLASIKGYSEHYQNIIWNTSLIPGTGISHRHPSMDLSYMPVGSYYELILILSCDNGQAVLSTSTTSISELHYYGPYLTFNPLETVPGSALFGSVKNSTIASDPFTLRRHIVWSGTVSSPPVEIVGHQSRSTSGTWSTVSTFASDMAGEPVMDASIGGDGLYEGMTMLFSDGEVVWYYRSEDGVNWTWQDFGIYNTPCRAVNLAPLSDGNGTPSVTTLRGAVPFELRAERWGSGGGGAGIGSPSGGGAATSATGTLPGADSLAQVRSYRTVIYTDSSSSDLTVRFGSVQLDEGALTTGREIPMARLDSTASGDEAALSPEEFLKTEAFTLTSSSTPMVAFELTASSPPLWSSEDASVSLALVDAADGSLVQEHVLSASLKEAPVTGGVMSFPVNTSALQAGHTYALQVHLAFSMPEAGSLLRKEYLTEYRTKRGASSSLAKGNIASEKKASALAGIPSTYMLSGAYPNPFNPSTTIRYALPSSGRTSLKVYDLLGREVATLVDGYTEAGYHEVHWNASSVSSGIYYARFMVTDDLGKVKFTKVSKLLLMK